MNPYFLQPIKQTLNTALEKKPTVWTQLKNSYITLKDLQ